MPTKPSAPAVATQPSTASLLLALTKERLVELGRIYNVGLSLRETKEEQIQALMDSGALAFRQVVRHMSRDELRKACLAHGLDDSGRARLDLAQRLSEAHGDVDTETLPATFMGLEPSRYFPKKGDIVQVRHRQWLAEEVVPAPEHGQVSLVSLVCLDDDNQGARLQVLWELELGARVLQPEAHGLGAISKLDQPRYFAAYLHALKWNAVTASDARLFQAPFRAGIKLMNHQLTPLKKALELPRANLFIADDVGLGKTIEAGLVLQELLLRQQVDFVLIVCPASVTLQWRDEMFKRFGLHFELYNRELVARRRRERGFGVNPWRTHQRFIISYQTLRRPEYRDPLLARLGEKARKSLLILDEAHNVAPASAAKYAVDSRITKVIRDEIGPKFENRLFLSATPHNGHSNSFSALLEILDPQRFTRGVPVEDVAELEPVMVRRLKADLRELKQEQFPKRIVVQLGLRHRDGAWHEEHTGRAIGKTEPGELLLAEKLAQYTQLMRPEKGAGQLVFTNLQKRLLSSVEAFSRTLQKHAESIGTGRAKTSLQLSLELEEEDYGADDDAIDETEAEQAAELSRLIKSPEGQAKDLLGDMVRLAEQHRNLPDAKSLALIDWIREHQCAGVEVGGGKKKAAWSDRRVLIFTEYGDTKRYLQRILGAAIAGTQDADRRIMFFHGAMSDKQRDEVQRAFNSAPSEHPVRILIATDAAREGVNLQGHCADLFHFDIPWNPARMEQRNGRIDRTLQPATEVRCHYFTYLDRAEDLVLEKLVKKVDVIQEELGSLGLLVMNKMAETLERRGITESSGDEIERAATVGGEKQIVTSELEAQRSDLEKLKREIDEAGRILNNSRNIVEFDPKLLKDALEVGLEIAGAGPLSKVEIDEPNVEAFALPELSESWQATLDTLRPPRADDEHFWDWRRRPPEPVVFKPPERIQSGRVHLHLEHPFVKRVLDRFRAQGYSAHDLSRVTIVRNPKDSEVRALAFGRLSLFGPGASRLHDQLVAVAAPWLESKAEGHLVPGRSKDDRKALEMLETLLAESPSLDRIGKSVEARLLESAPGDFATLWPYIQAEADALAHDAAQKLERRARVESDALRKILEGQREAIRRTMRKREQLALEFQDSERDERTQYEQDQKHMLGRLERIAKEMEVEPQEIEALYKITVRRLEPVGLVYLWPETR